MCGKKYLHMGKNTRNYIQYFLTVVLFTFCTCCLLRCLVCVVVSCLVCIVVVVLCVYSCHLMCICCTMCVLLFFYFRCRTAGYKSVFGRSCDRPPRHRFFLVSLCLQANAEMVPNAPSCHYMLFM